MDIRNRKALKAAAADALGRASYAPNQLALIHTGAAALFLVLTMLLNWFLETQIETTGGLSGLEMRTMLETAQTLLQMAGNLLLPFWTVGFLHTMLRISRGQEAAPASLAEGFRRFGPVLRLHLLQSALYMALAVFCVYPSVMIYMLTPLAGPLEDYLMANGVDASGNLVLDDAMLSGMMEHMAPVILIYLVLFAVVALPQFYRLRLTEFAVMDEPGTGALMAMRISSVLMYRNRMAFFKLDLSFWWYYLVDGLITLICYGDVLLAYAGVSLPVPEDVVYLIFYLAYLCVQVLFYRQCRSAVDATYAVAYDSLRESRIQAE